jgi:cellulose biosynthesis protein BcsQ
LFEEGKTASVSNIASSLILLGKKVCIIDFDNISFDLSNQSFDVKNFNGVNSKDFKENGLVLSLKEDQGFFEKKQDEFELKIKELKSYYDFVIIDTSPTSVSILPIQLMKLADLNLYVLKADYTPISYIGVTDLLMEEYDLKNIHFILTNVHKATNYNGNLIGSRFESDSERTGLFSRVRKYINYYL